MICRTLLLIASCLTFFFITFLSSAPSMAKIYRFSGGPSGGTYQYFASAVSTLAKKNNINILASSSGGSVENIRLINSGKASYAIAYSGHIFQARNGELKQDNKTYNQVMAVCYFYNAPAQLVVRKNSGITKATQLAKKRVGVGNAGSGAAANCELFFSQLKLWDKINRNFIGYRQAANAFKNKQLDAFWVFSGTPNAAIIETALQNDIDLIDIYCEAASVGFFKKHPYFTKAHILKNTYNGVTKDTETFADSTIWIASHNVSDDEIYQLLSIVFSKDGLKYMAEIHKSARAMSIQNGIKGIVTPLHKGAEKFWKEHGVIQ